MSARKKRSMIGRLFFGMLVLAGFLALAIVGRAWWVFRDRNPGYKVALSIRGESARKEPKPLQVGFGRFKITPEVGAANPPVWLAGFAQGRAATAVHDDLWATAIVLDDGYTRLGLVVLDAIGLFHDDVIRIRSQITREWGLSYVIVCTTHNHSTPDLMGLWGPSIFKTGVDGTYRQHVVDQAVFALGDAVYNLEPAAMLALHIPLDPEGLVADTRKPIVFDPDLRVLLFRSADGERVLGSLVGWANHPETPWSRNTEITADFPGFLREALADGVTVDGEKVLRGLGGQHVFVNGAVGGLMTTHPATVVTDPFTGTELKDPSHAKSRALGHQLARHVVKAVDAAVGDGEWVSQAPMALQARTMEIPLENRNFLLAGFLGLIDRGHVRWKHVRTEVAFIRLGDVSLVTIPGEIYPELVNGGVEQAPGADFDIEPLEVPPIRDMMPGRIQFILGLGNDELGYIIPKSQWDVEPPYLYGADKSPYGEINSPGPDTAHLLHQAIRGLIEAAMSTSP
jgi:hypothetical protein